MKCSDETIELKCVMSKNVTVGETEHLDFANEMFNDINSLLK
jgi:hypothetical protein